MTASRAFLEHVGGVLTERIFWYERSLDQTLSTELQAKLDRLSHSSIKIISAQEYTSLRPDWERVWWTLETETSQDVPSMLGVMQLSFEEWQAAMKSFTPDLNKTLIAIDGLNPVGILKLSSVRETCININYTAIASSHRRRGISSLLKSKAFELAKTLGADRIATQNHSTNQAIINANLNFGFKERDQELDYVVTLEEG